MSRRQYLPEVWDEQPVYRTEEHAIQRQEQLREVGICTGYRRCPGGWSLLHDPQGTISYIRSALTAYLGPAHYLSWCAPDYEVT